MERRAVFLCVFLCVFLLCSTLAFSKVVSNSSSILKDRELRFDILHRDHNSSRFRVQWNSTFEKMQYYLLRGALRTNFWTNKLTKSKTPLKRSYPTASKNYNLQIPVTNEVPNYGEYFIDLYVSDEFRYQYAIYDTGSDIVWIPCSECSDCNGQVGEPYSMYLSQSAYVYGCSECDQTYSCSDSNCTFTVNYLDGSQANGIVGTDTFSFALYNSNKYLSITNFEFGCALEINQFDDFIGGIAGFGLDSVSLPSQLSQLLGRNAFSSCLVRNDLVQGRSKLLLGAPAVAPVGIAYTPILVNKFTYSRTYYVQVTQVAVGSKVLNIPSSAWSFSSRYPYGGTILDSGTTLIYLVRSAYSQVYKEVLNQVSKQLQQTFDYGGYSPCFVLQGASPSNFGQYFPPITFTFKNGVKVKLLGYHYVWTLASNVACSIFQPSSTNFNLLGGFFQQNFLVVHDIQGRRIGFKAVDCSTGKIR